MVYSETMPDQVVVIAPAAGVTTLAVRPVEGEVGAKGYGKVVSGAGGEAGWRICGWRV